MDGFSLRAIYFKSHFSRWIPQSLDVYSRYSKTFLCTKLRFFHKFYYFLCPNIYLPKVNNRNTRTRCEIYSKLTIKIRRRSGISIVNFEHISHLVLVFLLFVNFEHVIAGWDASFGIRSELPSSPKLHFFWYIRGRLLLFWAILPFCL